MLTIIYKHHIIKQVQPDITYKQYQFLKSQHKECVLFYRRPPFYFNLKKEGIIYGNNSKRFHILTCNR